MSTNNLFHVSDISDLTTLSPKIPRGLDESSWEDITIPRVCFTPSIRQCLIGLQIPESEFKDISSVQRYVYIPENIKPRDIISNKEIVERALVFDAHITEETWVIRKVNVKLKYIIKVFNYRTSKPIVFKPLLVKDPKLVMSDGRITSYELKYAILKQLF